METISSPRRVVVHQPWACVHQWMCVCHLCVPNGPILICSEFEFLNRPSTSLATRARSAYRSGVSSDSTDCSVSESAPLIADGDGDGREDGK